MSYVICHTKSLQEQEWGTLHWHKNLEQHGLGMHVSESYAALLVWWEIVSKLRTGTHCLWKVQSWLYNHQTGWQRYFTLVQSDTNICWSVTSVQCSSKMHSELTAVHCCGNLALYARPWTCTALVVLVRLVGLVLDYSCPLSFHTTSQADGHGGTVRWIRFERGRYWEDDDSEIDDITSLRYIASFFWILQSR